MHEGCSSNHQSIVHSSSTFKFHFTHKRACAVDLGPPKKSSIYPTLPRLPNWVVHGSDELLQNRETVYWTPAKAENGLENQPCKIDFKIDTKFSELSSIIESFDQAPVMYYDVQEKIGIMHIWMQPCYGGAQWNPCSTDHYSCMLCCFISWRFNRWRSIVELRILGSSFLGKSLFIFCAAECEMGERFSQHIP